VSIGGWAAIHQPERTADRSEAEIIAQELSTIGAALTTAKALQEVSHHWDAVYEAMRRADTSDVDR
jgi:hypothetical protein